jgi:hypothetical protein
LVTVITMMSAYSVVWLPVSGPGAAAGGCSVVIDGSSLVWGC